MIVIMIVFMIMIMILVFQAAKSAARLWWSFSSLPGSLGLSLDFYGFSGWVNEKEDGDDHVQHDMLGGVGNIQQWLDFIPIWGQKTMMIVDDDYLDMTRVVVVL